MNHGHVGRSPRRCSASLRSARWRRLSLLVLVPAGLITVMFPLGRAFAASDTLYLRGDGVPGASLSTGVPTTVSLADYNGSGSGLLLEISVMGLGETDPAKYQMWATAAGSIDLSGSTSLTFWSATADFEGGQRGVVLAGLYDCDSALSGCNLIQQAQLDMTDWSGGSTTWVEHVINFGAITHSIVSDRTLALKLVVGNSAYDDMVFAYDTTSYPSRLTVQLASSTTTTTTTTTTVPPPTTTTTTVPPPTTTTITTTTTVPPPTTTTITTTTTPPETPGEPSPPDQLGDQASGDDDVALAPLPEAGDGEASVGGGLSRTLFNGLELVIPPSGAAAILSPLLLLEAFVDAFTDAGAALLLPGLLLLLGAGWVANESRLRALVGSLRISRRGAQR